MKGSPWSDLIGAAISHDDAVTWCWISDFPGGKGHDPASHYFEPHGVQAADGRVIVHIRNHGHPHYLEVMQTESFDMGISWTQPHPIGIWGRLAHPLRTSDGTLVTCIGHRRDPWGIHVAVSDGHGESWSAPVVLNIDSFGDMGCPSTVELEPGRFLTVWYDQMASERVPCLRQARWRL